MRANTAGLELRLSRISDGTGSYRTADSCHRFGLPLLAMVSLRLSAARSCLSRTMECTVTPPSGASSRASKE